MTTKPSDQTIVLNLLRGAVPEKAAELCRLWTDQQHSVEVTSSGASLTLNATSKRIKFDTKTVDFFWLLGFAAWRAIEVYAPALVLATSTGVSIDTALKVDHGRGQFEFDFNQRIAAAHNLRSAGSTADIQWPDDIPMPTADRASLDNAQAMAVSDLVGLAFAFAMLHELKHVMFRAAGDAPGAGYAEELACDVWARETMTSNMEEYADNHGYTYTQVAQKRAMGIALAAIIVHAMTPTHETWGSNDYPPIAERIRAMIDGHNLSEGSPFWTFTACLLIAIMRQEGRQIELVAASDKAVVEGLLDLIG
ncbi:MULTISPECIES: phage exclusion protein Lit family protein [Acetobacter]|jgi:hypothetical protein|uniref:Peptidase U49, Lit peptidase n=1 Tax=Acetobacter lovaniensis TaxID=104100 RepID=A0A841QJC4_9PROT|nr:phage exclusion protein Lit family protein [Acetobacter lovaniensis]MBB6458077.1 hypothetical protein [Acetobacter lovaniensis]MCP1240588.1 phage exclusion protein Lit family protein [Acetobacter lovaniensis]NHN82383.1 peptidase U49, Lit peptidase [Acetobacter lovaniensis]GBQ74421.1 hypothetical protein AA0474_3222 [Acetobacter lovaniensis NRIC 0474]